MPTLGGAAGDVGLGSAFWGFLGGAVGMTWVAGSML